MQSNSDIVVTDTSCLILLSKIDELQLLGFLAKHVYVTSIVREEYGRNLPQWIEIKDPVDNQYQEILQLDLDQGEASVIALCLELNDPVLLMDDLKGRNIAQKLGVKFSGTFGLILKAKQAGILKKVTPVLKKIRCTDFRFSEELFQEILKEAGEY